MKVLKIALVLVAIGIVIFMLLPVCLPADLVDNKDICVPKSRWEAYFPILELPH